jgi:3-isopropylmalate/(R)-2-methylmalate dehydratase large subunit
MKTKAITLFEKLWDRHVVEVSKDDNFLIYVDRHLVYEVTSPQAFEGLRQTGRKVWRSDSSLATVDHNVPTLISHRTSVEEIPDKLARIQIRQLEKNCKEYDLKYFGLNNRNQGIIHVIGPELGATLPGMTVVAGDSHTSTHGAFAALAFGIGTSDVEHVLATQCMWLKKLRTMEVRIDGPLSKDVTAKDIVMHLIAKIGTAGASGFAIEFRGDAVTGLSMEGRMTLCNMAIEAGARVGLVAFDNITTEYLNGRAYSPKGTDWDAALSYWRTLITDEGATFDRSLVIDASTIRPMVTWGTSPEMAVPVDGKVPNPNDMSDPTRRADLQRALDYMGLEPDTPITSIRPDTVFIGSCTNARLEDLRAAAEVVRGRKIAKSLKRALVVPGSGLVKEQAESEGLDRVFMDAGFEWRQPGCSMCLGMNEDRLEPGERCASTSNRNFEGRQGAGGRTHLVSPVMAAAAAIEGHFVDVTGRIK